MSIEQVVLQRQAELAKAMGVPVPPALTPDTQPLPAPAPAQAPAPAPAPVAPTTVTLTREEYDKLLTAAKPAAPAHRAEIEATLDGGFLTIKVPLLKNPSPSKTGRSMTVARSGPRPWTAVLVDGRQVRLGEVSAYVTL